METDELLLHTLVSTYRMCQDNKLPRLQVNKLVSLEPRPEGMCGVNENHMTLDNLEVKELQLKDSKFPVTMDQAFSREAVAEDTRHTDTGSLLALRLLISAST